MAPRVAVVVSEAFLRAPIYKLLKLAGRPETPSEVARFASECLLRWYEEFKSPRGAAPADRRADLLRLVRSPARGELSVRICADLEGKVSEAAFGRAVAGRFTARPAGAKMALREALLLGLQRLRAEADAKAGRAGQSGPGTAAVV
jgi:hypothetical protein